MGAAKAAIVAGLALTMISMGLIGMGDFIAWISGAVNNPGGVQTGHNLTGSGELIIGALFVIIVIVVAVWIYDKSQPQSSYGGF